MFLFYLSLLHLTLGQDIISPLIFSDCKHLILPSLCQCYHSGDESQLRCHHIRLQFLPKLPNNMYWNALDFSFNNLTSIDSHVFSDIYVEKLDLKSNVIQTIDITAFERIENLKQLFIDHNQLKEFDPKILMSPGISLGMIGIISNFDNLVFFQEIFDMSYNPFGYLNLGEIFYQLPVLKQFYAISCQLNNTSLQTLLKLTINNHRHYSIELIDLSYNNLTSLCNNLFNSFDTLIELRLNNNNIYSIDNYFIHSLSSLKILNLAFNSIEYVPNLFSSSLENWNLSSNNIRYLNDYFASNLQSIRVIDFDSNKYLNSISSRSFCFLNLLTLAKLSFRSNNILSLHNFSQFFCRLLDHQRIIDLNNNINLKCDCMLIQFEKYFINYLDLTCTQQGQDRYFISKSTNLSFNCSEDFCFQEKKTNLCLWSDATQSILEGTCQEKLIEKDNSTKNESRKTTIDFKPWENVTRNSTVFYERRQKSMAVPIHRLDYICFFILYVTFHRFCGEINKL